jgi:hypothetical protein
MVSTLVSYEAERLTVGRLLEKRKEGEHKYNDTPRYPFPLLTFKNTDGKFSGMNNFMLAYPSVFLARIYHPVVNLSEKKTLGEIRNAIFKIIKSRLTELKVDSLGSPEGDIQKWDWYALLLLDKHEVDKGPVEWAKEGYDGTESNYESDDEKADSGPTGKKSHFEEIKRCLLEKNYMPNVGFLKKDQIDNLVNHLTDLCLGSPAICCMRTFQASYPSAAGDIKVFQSAYKVGTGFLSLFNKQESIAIINEFEEENAYHKNVIRYALHGNIQAMLDEFVYQLRDSGSLANHETCADFIRNILTVNAANLEVKTTGTINKDKKPVSMRTHYAIPFGLGSNSDLKNGSRQIKVREAFNSPFRPFVLTSTSIGQEGLDFHFYCSKLIHWNLPTNPIDLEQREGRIKRFKGLNIRRKIADRYKLLLTDVNSNENIWKQLFSLAEMHKPSDQCDLIPFWHIDGEAEHDIKTLIPIYQYSKDFEKLRYIKTVLGNYRMTFGQPRQEELIYILGEIEKTLENRKMLTELSIDLCPMSYINSDSVEHKEGSKIIDEFSLAT